MAGRTEVENNIDEIRGYIERSGFELYIPEALSVREDLIKIDSMLSYYEMKEATTLLELALWKAKIDKAGDDDGSPNREAYRIEVPGPVKETIMQYLYPAGQYPLLEKVKYL